MTLRGLDVVDAVRVVSVGARRQRLNPDDVAAHAPEALRDPGGGGWPALVDEPALTPVAWQALRELTARLKVNEQRLTAQQRQIDELVARLDAIRPLPIPLPPQPSEPSRRGD